MTGQAPWEVDLPTGWGKPPLLAVGTQSRHRNRGLVETNLLSLSYGRIVAKAIESNEGLLPESFETYQIVEPNDVVFRFTDLQNDKRSLRSARVRQRGIITSAYMAFTPRRINARLFEYLMRAYDVNKVFYGLGGGLRQSLKYVDVRRMPIISPPPAKQVAIADFLDRNTAQIDALIEKQHALINRLRERRQALVDVAFRSSADRHRTRVQHLLAQRPRYGVLVPKYSVDSESTVPLVRVGDLLDLKPGRDFARISEEQSMEYRRTVLRGGEVLLGVVGRMGTAVVVPEWLAGANVARAVAVLHCRPETPASLFRLWLSSTHFLDQAQSATSGDSIQPTLGMADLWRFEVHWPHPAVLERVTTHLDRRTAETDSLIAKAKRFTKLAQERRAALITAAVTGQIDIKETGAA